MLNAGKPHPARSYVAVRLAGSTATIEARTAGIADWALRYIGCWWPRTAETRGIPQSSRRVVCGVVDGEAYERTAALVAMDPEPVATFIRVPGLRRTVDDVVYAHCPHRQVGYEHDRATGRIAVAGLDEAQVKLDVARIARGLVTDQLEQKGWTVLHAACVTGADGGTLVLGHRGAGKTTTSLTMSEISGRSLLANDRCLLKAESDGVRVLPWPGSVSVGFGLLAALGWTEHVANSVRRGTEQHPFQHPSVAELVAAGQFAPRFADDGRELKVELMPQQLREWFGIDVTAEATLRQVYFPEVTAGAVPTVGSATTSPDCFREHTLFGLASGYPNFLGLPPAPPPDGRPDTAQLFRALTELPTFHIRLAHDVAANRQVLQAALGSSAGLTRPEEVLGSPADV